MTHECRADRSFRTQHDGCYKFLAPWTSRINFLDGEVSFPAAHVQKAIVCHTSAKILKLRINREDIPRTHRRHVRHAKVRLSRAELLLRSTHQYIQIERSNGHDNEKRDQTKY